MSQASSHKVLALIALLLLAFFLRFYQVGQLPTILNRDEAALAYNAYLIKQTGLDEWQQHLPLTFKSFGDYKLPGYIYLLVPFYALFGTSDLVVRLPSVLAGVMIVYLSYHLARRLIKNKVAALLLALVVAVSPVFVFYSRMAWEANLGLMLTLILLNLVLTPVLESTTGLVKSVWWKSLLMMLVALTASLTYNSPWLYLPFLVPLASLWSIQVLQQTKTEQIEQNWRRWWQASLPVLSLGSAFALTWLILRPVTQQKQAITIFTDPTIRHQFINYRRQLPAVWQSILGNRYLFWLKIMARNLVQSFSPQFLVRHGGQHPWHNLPTQAHLYWTVYGLGLIGLGAAVRSLIRYIVDALVSTSKPSKEHLKYGIILYLLVISLAPAIVTVDAPHATRSLLFFVIFCVLAVLGAQFLLKLTQSLLAKIGTQSLRQTLWPLFSMGLFLLALETSLFFHNYFFQYPQQQTMFKPGFAQAIQRLEEKFPHKKIAIVADGYQYILAAWYLKLEPAHYFATNIRQQPDKIGLSYGQQVSHYHFIAQPQDRAKDEDLVLLWNETEKRWQLKRY
jgi:4-amino-4-deoxy-L-arabinose transferase-like glycosyltransferase